MDTYGLGDWHGAYIGHQLVADLGIFRGNGVGRYQTIETLPDFRCRGIAGTLVFEAICQAMAAYNLHTLVIVAEENLSAVRLYRSLHFMQTEKQVD